MEIRFVYILGAQAATVDHSRKQANRECTPAEPEKVYPVRGRVPVTGLIGAAEKLIQFEHVSFEAPAEGSADDL
jgi:hypothetical protein